MILSVDNARSLAEAAMTAVGHTDAEAAIIADHLIDCELRGLSFGGLPRALSVIEHIQSTCPTRRPIEIVRETPVSATLDGGNQVGYLVARRATDIAIEKAAATGVAVVGASKTWYTGMFSYYLEKITRAGLVGMIAGSGGPKVAPHGGTEARFSTNPIAFGFPTQTHPVIWDIGTSSIMLGEVMLAGRLGTSLPEGRAFDTGGQPTLDPASALDGAFTVWGGHKGSGLAMMVQLLGILGGQAAAPQGLTDCGFFAVVVDPAVLGSTEEFRQKVTDFTDSVRATRPLDPQAPVRVPFDRSIAERTRRVAADAVEVPDQVVDALTRISGVSASA